MAKKPDPTSSQIPVPDVRDVSHAPFIFSENAPSFGCTNGVINITLSANRVTSSSGKIVNEEVVVAYLRGNIQAAISLRAALDQALLMAAPVAGDGKNKPN
jgi:hypothetical protein